jgi:acetyl esterase
VRWITTQTEDLGLDRERIAVGGDSAGGDLTAVATLTARDAGIQLRCQILIYPCRDNRDVGNAYPSRAANAQVPPLTSSIMQWMIGNYVSDPKTAADWRVSPMAAADVSGVAPALLITGSCDPLHDEGVQCANRLDAAGVA